MHRRASAILIFTLIVTALSGCEGNDLHWWKKIPGYNGYWWQRGQPRSVDQLVEHAQGKLGASLSNYSAQRPELVPAVEVIQSSLTAAYRHVRSGRGSAEIATQVGKAEDKFIDIETQLSIGSRAAYGELSGEMRTFFEKLQAGQNLGDEGFREAFGLYTSRVLTFLANELSVPAPVLS